MRWLITNRNQDKPNNIFGCTLDALTFWTFDPAASPTSDIKLLSSWTQCTVDQFRAALVSAASKFPNPITTLPEKQKHLTLFIHGYDNDWLQAMDRYNTIATQLFDGPNSLGELISFDWPSKASLLGYLPDRAEARKTGDDLTNVLSELYDWMSKQQIAATISLDNACHAKTSIIAHSMGNYALEYAMNALWTPKNRPLLLSLMQEVIMVAADVDNDLFRNGDATMGAAWPYQTNTLQAAKVPVATDSVVTGRSLDEIGKAHEHVWRSNLSAKANVAAGAIAAPAPSRTTPAKADGGSATEANRKPAWLNWPNRSSRAFRTLPSSADGWNRCAWLNQTTTPARGCVATPWHTWRVRSTSPRHSHVM